MSAGFLDLERRFGWTYDINLERRLINLDPTRTVHFDWQHVIFVSGIFQANADLFVRPIKNEIRTFTKLHWQFPKCFDRIKVGSAVDVALSKEKFACNASEGLAILLIYCWLCQSRRCAAARET